MLAKTVIIDVGAGLRSLYEDWLKMNRTFTIYVIHPHPDILKTIRENPRLVEYIKGDRLLLFEYAMTTDENTYIPYYCCNDKTSSSIYPFDPIEIRKWKYGLGKRLFETTSIIKVKTRTLRHFIEEQSIPRIAFLNVDVQGYSLSVLKGLSDKNWNDIAELNVKVHSPSAPSVYVGQCFGCDVLELCRRNYFSLLLFTKKSRDQEDIFGFCSELLLAKNIQVKNLSRKAINELK